MNTSANLGKHCFARSWWTIEQNVSVESVVLFSVARGYRNIS